MALTLSTEVKYVKGVGPRLASLLGERGIATVEDLVLVLPFRYEDRSHLRPVRDLIEGESATVMAQVRTLAMKRTRRGMLCLEMTVGDGSGVLHCTWYNAEFLRDRFQSGQTVALFGRLERDPGRMGLVMRQPEFEILDDAAATPDGLGASLKLGRIVPVYEAIGELSSGRLRRLVHSALEALPQQLPETLPDDLRQRLKLLGRRPALEQVHFPPAEIPLEQLQQARTPGHVRLIMEELFFLQAGLELKRRKLRRQEGAVMQATPAIRERLKQMLPFHPTDDQKRVLKEIVDDLRSGHPMRRLLQGDVGSGKTIVALEAAVVAIENGYQVALMAPTQILAEQHYLSARERLQDYRVALVTAATKARRARSRTAPPQLAIGTQALLEGGYPFERLGLVIVDEQHRFGVLQRFQLMTKGGQPAHLLVMTATPIPRTLALALYGDLESSVIRQAPPGALPITTRVLAAARAGEVYEFVRRRVAAGRQAYFVYPIIEESEKLDLKPALRMFEHLQKLMPELRVALLHGRMSAEEKNAVMQDFRHGAVQVLVATTVIEVGVDVPNATLMVIEHAERFGIAQLHQLRGRIGRPQKNGRGGGEQSHCFLLHGDDFGEAARRRLGALAQTRDGFALAELDLKLRGPGEFFGTRQSGAPVFHVAQPLRDQALMELARDEARHYLELATPAELRQLVLHLQARWQRRYGLVEVG